MDGYMGGGIVAGGMATGGSLARAGANALGAVLAGFGVAGAYVGTPLAMALTSIVLAALVVRRAGPGTPGAVAARFRVPPALLDAALQVGSWPGFAPAPRPGELLLPFSWSGIRLHRAGASARQIGDAVGINPRSVARIVRRHAAAQEPSAGAA